MTILLALALLSPPAVRGVAIAPHYEGTRSPAQVTRMVDEIADLGANTLQVVVQWGQETIESTAIAPYRWGTDDAEVRRVLRHAKARGLKALVFPIVRLKVQGPGQWRGKLKPADRAAWWAAYRAFVLHYAKLAADEGAAMLSVGSELGTMEADEVEWRRLVRDVRRVFDGKLTYSANWDHFTHVGFWDALDYVGLNAYHPITTRNDASEDELRRSWTLIRQQLERWLDFVDRPLLFTEVGYPSVDGGAVRPYAHAAKGPVDLEEQRRAWQAFVDAWRGHPRLAGVFVWIWSGAGGASDIGYMPKGKPAEDVLRRYFGGG
ncbi:MAG: hypothetical protein H6704_23505 [Myxococcales bacterium]|nr:hypothetical protein [Myxococcales bacterium]